MVDYSKWDKLEVSSSGEESEDENDAGEELPAAAWPGEAAQPSMSSAAFSCTSLCASGDSRLKWLSGYRLGPPTALPSTVFASRRLQALTHSLFPPAERSAPGVYRVGQGESVTIPGRNVTITSKPGAGQAVATAAASSGTLAKRTAPQQQTPSAVDTKGPTTTVALRDRLTRNGGATERYWWSQETDRVTVSFFCPAATAAKDVRLEVPEERRLTAGLVDGTLLAEGELFGPLDPDCRAPVNEAEVRGIEDWEMLTPPPALLASGSTAGTEAGAEAGAASIAPPSRLLSVTLRKKPLGGVTLWWRTVFKGDPEIAPEALQDRSAAQHQRAEAFQKAFADATAMFKQRMQEKRESGEDGRMSIDNNDDEK